MTAEKLLAEECLAVADSLRSIRQRLNQMLLEGKWPEDSWPDITTVQVLGLDVAMALDRLGRNEPPIRTPCPGPYDPSERR